MYIIPSCRLLMVASAAAASSPRALRVPRALFSCAAALAALAAAPAAAPGDDAPPGGVRWAELKPARPYRRDASAEPSRAALATCAELRHDFALEPGDSIAYIGPAAEAWRGVLDAQLRAAVADAELVARLVGVAEIADAGHPAWTAERPAYLAYAKVDLARGTVLGFYGGTVRLASESARDEVSPHRSGKAIALRRWTVGGSADDARWDSLVVDGNHGSNELVMVNDYRFFDVVGDAQPNAAMLQVWLADEELPRVVFVTTSAIAAGEEIRTDYGEAYWEGLPWGWVAIANALIALRLLAHRRSRKPDV